MDNDSIMKSICNIENIDLTDYYPITEDGTKSNKDFDKVFSLNRIYQYEWLNYRKRIRFVKYRTDDNHIVLIVSKLRISNIIKSTYTLLGNEVYFKGNSKKILLKDIERIFKFKQIKEKMGR